MNTLILISLALLWVAVLFLGFLLLGALRAMPRRHQQPS